MIILDCLSNIWLFETRRQYASNERVNPTNKAWQAVINAIQTWVYLYDLFRKLLLVSLINREDSEEWRAEPFQNAKETERL